jgi:hypothetical protein
LLENRQLFTENWRKSPIIYQKLEKIANYLPKIGENSKLFTENRRKSPKLVIITLAPRFELNSVVDRSLLYILLSHVLLGHDALNFSRVGKIPKSRKIRGLYFDDFLREFWAKDSMHAGLVQNPGPVDLWPGHDPALILKYAHNREHPSTYLRTSLKIDFILHKFPAKILVQNRQFFGENIS